MENQFMTALLNSHKDTRAAAVCQVEKGFGFIALMQADAYISKCVRRWKMTVQSKKKKKILFFFLLFNLTMSASAPGDKVRSRCLRA